jgi:Tfp pilus assembly protein PilW
MDALADKLLELMAAFGLGVLLVLGVGFYLFHQLKREAERRDQASKQKDHPE